VAAEPAGWPYILNFKFLGLERREGKEGEGRKGNGRREVRRGNGMKGDERRGLKGERGEER